MRTIRTLVLAVALAGTAGACSDEGGNRAADVATLDPDGGSAAAPEGGDGGAPVPGGGQGGRGISPEFQDALVEFAECMREHGVDMPDPVFDENGRITQSLGGGRPVDAEALQEAQAACGRDGMPGIAVGGAGTSGSFTTGERIRGGDG